MEMDRDCQLVHWCWQPHFYILGLWLPSQLCLSRSQFLGGRLQAPHSRGPPCMLRLLLTAGTPCLSRTPCTEGQLGQELSRSQVLGSARRFVWGCEPLGRLPGPDFCIQDIDIALCVCWGLEMTTLLHFSWVTFSRKKKKWTLSSTLTLFKTHKMHITSPSSIQALTSLWEQAFSLCLINRWIVIHSTQRGHGSDAIFTPQHPRWKSYARGLILWSQGRSTGFSSTSDIMNNKKNCVYVASRRKYWPSLSIHSTNTYSLLTLCGALF